MKAIIRYPNVVIEQKEVGLTPQEAQKLENMSCREKANLIFEKIQAFPSYEQMTGLGLIHEALETRSASIVLAEEGPEDVELHAL